MSLRFDPKFRPVLARVRGSLTGDDQLLFDFLCAAGLLGWRLPVKNISLRKAAGPKDPRRRLAREFDDVLREKSRQGRWKQPIYTLVRLLTRELANENITDENRPLRILLAYATIGLAPDCVLPRHGLPRAAWDTAVRLFPKIFPAKVRALKTLAALRPRLAALEADAAHGLRLGRRASGRAPGDAGKELAVDPKLVAEVGKALGRRLQPGYMARYLFYTKPGDHIWPHPDDPKFAVTLLICVAHKTPGKRSSRSALVTYPPDGTIRRYEMKAGNAIALEPGLVHAREPVRRGEKVALLSIALKGA